MALTDVPVTTFTRTGTVLPTATAGDVPNGHSMVNDGATGLIVTNTGSTVARTVTFTITRTVDGQAVSPRVESIPLSSAQAMGPFPVADYGTVLTFVVSHAELTLRAVRF